MTTTSHPIATARRVRRRHTLGTWAYLAPFLLLFALFVLAPTVAGVGISLTEWRIVGSPRFIGLAAYAEVLGDSTFLIALRNTLYYIALSVPAHVILSLALALLLDTKLRGTKALRALVYLPSVIMVTVIGIMWSWLYDEQFGLIDHYLRALGLGTVPWLTDGNWAMPAIVIASLWWTLGTTMVIYLAGLQGIPEELHEAAALDGAGRWRRFWHVTLPGLRHVNTFVVPFTLITSWQVFGQVYMLTGGGPGRSTFVLTQYVYLTAFQDYRMGTAAAASVLMLLLVLASSIAVVKSMRVSI